VGSTPEYTAERKKAILSALLETGSPKDAFHLAGVARRTVDYWKKNDRQFAAAWNTAKREGKQRQLLVKGDALILDPNPELPKKPRFREWREMYTGFPVPAHQEPIVEALEDLTNLVVIVLGPPGSGKDVTSCHYVLNESCDGWKRVAWIMESEKFSIRRTNELIGPYLTDPRTYEHTPVGPNTRRPTRSLIEDYGPFEWKKGMRWPDGEPVPRTTWTASEKYFVRSRAPQADPNLWATGVNGTLYGSRVDLMVISDPFTVENQRSPTVRADQLAWMEGTVESRLDEGGRLVILGTRVAAYDNYGVLLDRYTAGAHIIYENGFYQKWSNGTATVIYPAIQVGPDGSEVSYWPEKFPLYDHLVVHGKPVVGDDGEPIPADDLDGDILREYAAQGAERKRGLDWHRTSKPEMFQRIYQQAPAPTEGGDFTDMVLDHCDDPERTLGVIRPGEELVLGIDPARTGGAGWVLWAWDRENEKATVVDLFFGERLGLVGLREKLLVGPITRYMPRYAVYESNYELSVTDHPEVQAALAGTATELVLLRTGSKRSDPDIGLPSMVFYMRNGTIRFPARTVEDKQAMARLKHHFQAWDREVVQNRRSKSGSMGHDPDDLAMAAWQGWQVLVERFIKKKRRQIAQRRPSAAVQAKWGYRMPHKDHESRQPATDLVGLWMGNAER